MSSRSRRKTAGKRMTELVGKALEDDAAFWGHSTWAEDGGDGSAESDANESYRDSDLSSVDRVDTFDSDFDDSESDEEAEQEKEAEAEQIERDLAKQERRQQQKQKRGYVDIASKASKQLKKIPKGKKMITGDGWNAGIILTIPPPGTLPLTVREPVLTEGVNEAEEDDDGTASTGAATVSHGTDLAKPDKATSIAETKSAFTAASHPTQRKDQLIPEAPTSTASSTVASAKVPGRNGSKAKGPTLASTRRRRATQTTSKYGSRYRSAKDPTIEESTTTSGYVQSESKELAVASAKTSKRERKTVFTQEELLLEAANDTEPANQRWLLARKRHMEDSMQGGDGGDKAHKQHHHYQHQHAKVIERYHSRRGALTVITFPEMDHVPAILSLSSKKRAANKSASHLDETNIKVCAITGKRARYRDPATLLGYYDAAAYRQLRQLDKTGELGNFMQQKPSEAI